MSQPLRLPALALALSCLIATACHRPTLLIDANADDLRTARTVALAFYQQLGTQAGLADVPFITVGVEGGPGYSYDVAHNVLFVTPYSHADFDTQRIFAKACGSQREEPVYDDLMFRFFTAHQLMHLVYDRMSLAEVSQYEEELRINTLTWLFLEENDLLSPGMQELMKVSERLEGDLVDRFPSVTKGVESAQTLTVNDNASYWYVTAVSLMASHADAERFGSSRGYVASLTDSRLSARVHPAEAH